MGVYGKSDNIQQFLQETLPDREVINPGGHYNSSSGKYTVPYDGIYQFSVSIQYEGGYAYVDVYVDDSNVGSQNDHWSSFRVFYRSPTFILELTAGQTVHVRLGYNSGGADGSISTLCSYFTGYLISAN